MKDEGFEFLMAVLPPAPNKSPALKEFLTSLAFIRDKKEFRTVDLHRFLRLWIWDCMQGDRRFAGTLRDRNH